ncbi:MAG: virulence protein RhuM/Fic/DOC family protein [Flavobacteriales bacterium]|nr:virulence protein RhuM/Fic/DOC family protein [Flavobacteriales bacterium]
MENSIEIYNSEGETRIEVRFEQETVWLSLNQISELFGRDKSVISRHLKKIYDDDELNRLSTVAKNATVQMEGNRKVEREIETYNLDAILSVGYKVNSKQGTQFRIWATQRLKEHLIQGYTINKQRLSQLKQSVKLIQTAVASEALDSNQSKEIIEVLTDFALGLDILDGYDNQSLQVTDITEAASYKISYKEAIEAIAQLREKFGGSELFGKEKDASFRSSIATIDQTFGGNELYPSMEEKAANLLYFVVKNHSFVDGNKRIAAWLFVWYLNMNGHLYNASGKFKIENNALASLTLMIALSKPEEKELMIKVVVNSINKRNT